MKFEGRTNTIKTRESLWRRWVKPNMSPDGSDFDEAVQLWESQLEPNTVRSLIYIARDWVKQETGQDLPTRKHITRVSRSKQQQLPRAFTRAEIAALVDALDSSDQLYLPFMLALHTGMRRGEIWGLTWDDIDVLNDQITIQRSYDGPTKSGKSRIVPISFGLEKVFLADKRFISYNCIGKESKRKRSKNKNVVPHNFDPNPLLRKLMKKAGVKGDYTFHSLRHTFATLALEAGRSPLLVSQALGHAKVSTTLDIYWSVSKEKLDLGFLDE
jgi:ATP-dependent helicase/nuclease subunit A